MIKKLIFAIFLIVLLAGAFVAWRFFTSNTAFSGKSKFIFVPTASASYSKLLQTVKDSQLVKNPGAFDFIARRMGLDQQVKPGRYEIRNGMSLVEIVRLFRNGQQAPVNLVITRVRTKERLASIIGRKLECDSADVMQFLSNPDSLRRFELDTNTVMVMVYPNTYTYFWNTTPSTVFAKLYEEYKKIWNDERMQQAQRLGLTPAQAYILASIVEEETNAKEEKGHIASVYLNRVNKGMRLQADPTVKFALKDFGLRRIREKHLVVESPYNTYRNAGLPPGPICTPSLETIDAVLQSPQTNYLYFVAKSDFSGRHVFSETYREHLRNARAFQKALDAEQRKRNAAREDTGTKK